MEGFGDDAMSESEEGQVARQKKLLEDRKKTMSYLKDQVETLDRSMARNFAQGNFALASQDARKMASILEVLGDLDVS